MLFSFPERQTQSIEPKTWQQQSELSDCLEKECHGVLSFLTYNVFGLPFWVTGNDSQWRMKLIAPLLKQYDVVGLQEVFVTEYYPLLAMSSVRKNKIYFNHKTDSRRIYGSGLAMFLNPQVIEYVQRHFGSCHGFEDDGHDCLASKGFQVVRLRLAQGVEIDVYNTHLDAGGEKADDRARESQARQLVDFLNNYSLDHAVVFLGDTNLYSHIPTRRVLLERLIDEAGLMDSCQAVNCDEQNHIDRILVRSSEKVVLTVDSWNREEQFVDPNGKDLSDHPAISVKVFWEYFP